MAKVPSEVKNEGFEELHRGEHPHPSISTGNPEPAMGVVLRDKIKAAMAKVPQETSKNHMMVGLDSNYCFYQPHNLRLYFDFNNRNLYKPTMGKTMGIYDIKIINSKELLFSSINFNLRIKKTMVEVINKLEHDKWYKISITTNVEQEIDEIFRKKILEAVEELKKFIEQYGGSSNFELLNMHSENKIMGEKAISYIPLKMKFQNKFVKKVYNDKAVEFKNQGLTINYLTNRAIEEHLPEISSRLDLINNSIEMQNPLVMLKDKTKEINDVIKNKRLVLLLSQEEKNDFETWLFTKFGFTI